MKLRFAHALALGLASAALLHTLGQPSAADQDGRAVLGERLFFDSTLSADATISCASCHRPELAFTDAQPRSLGVAGRQGTRNAPSLLGVARVPRLNWDGRSVSLEEQVVQPFVTETEHGLPSNEALVERVLARAEYRALFETAFGGDAWPPRVDQIAAALAAYLHSLEPQHRNASPAPVPDNAARGQALFFGSAGCAQCHPRDDTGTPGTDHRYHAIGVGLGTLGPGLGAAIEAVEKATPGELNALVLSEPAVSQLGRYVVTRNLEDIGRFRTPSLRNVAITAPYFHDGSVATLEAAVEREIYYRREARAALPALSREDRDDLVAYLKTVFEKRTASARQ